MLTLLCIYLAGYLSCYWFVKERFFSDTNTIYTVGDRYMVLFVSFLSWFTFLAILFAYMLMGLGVNFERRAKW